MGTGVISKCVVRIEKRNPGTKEKDGKDFAQENGRKTMNLFEEYFPLKEKMFQVLKPDGTLQPDGKPPIGDKETLSLYQKMLFIRTADQKGLMLQRQSGKNVLHLRVREL